MESSGSRCRPPGLSRKRVLGPVRKSRKIRLSRAHSRYSTGPADLENDIQNEIICFFCSVQNVFWRLGNILADMFHFWKSFKVKNWALKTWSHCHARRPARLRVKEKIYNDFNFEKVQINKSQKYKKVIEMSAEIT